MSAILDALKKLEADTAAPGTEGGSEVSSAGSSQARPGFVIAGCVVLFLVLVAGVWKLATLSVSPTDAKTRTAQTRVRLDLPDQEEDRGKQTKHSRATALAQAEPAVADTDKAEPDAGKDESDSPAESVNDAGSGNADESEPPARQEQSGETAPEQTENSSGTRESQTPSVPDKAETSQEPASNGSAQPDTASEPEIMEDGSLTLQAISWADAPENRIAVINGKVCRQKERINGYRIQVINPDDVRVTDGEKTWRLNFGGR